jgi:hypothetical protein
MPHGAVERMLASEGRELLRRLFQDHVDLRGPGDLEDDGQGVVLGSDGVERKAARVRGRNLGTVFGDVRVERRMFSRPDVPSLVPLDAQLNLPPEVYSHGLQEATAHEIAVRSFDGVVETLKRTTGREVPKRQVEELVVRAAQDFDAFYATRAEVSQKARATTGPIGVLTFDGKGVRMHAEALREATRRAAEARAQAPQRFSLGLPKHRTPEPDGKRMAIVAAVYTIATLVRRPEEIVGELDRVQVVPKIKRPRPEQKRVWASLVHEPPEVIAEAFAEALRRDPKKEKRWVALIDGNEVQLELVQAASTASELPVTIILDIIHVAGYLWAAAHAFHEPKSLEARKWVRERLLEILRGRASHVAAGMRRSATLRGLSKTARKPVDDAANYLLKHKEFLRYDEYLAAGFPIATGVIEGACRHLIKDRMDFTGAIWGLERAEAVLQLRALHTSGDFEAYWSFHENRDYERNHASRYAANKPPEVRSNRPARPGGQLRLIKS